MNRNIQSLGGISRGVISRSESLKKYNDNPNICTHCLKIIVVKDGQKIQEARRKFCTRSCAASFNNHLKTKPKPLRFCKTCLAVTVTNQRIVCDSCKETELGKRTKGDLFHTRCSWQSARSSIRRHAALVWKTSGKKLECEVCGYDLYVEIAHIEPVSDFSEGSLIQEINSISNLKALCPNHHWEFDNLLRESLVRS